MLVPITCLMALKRVTVLLFALVLVPSAYMAWTWRDMPHLGLEAAAQLHSGSKSR